MGLIVPFISEKLGLCTRGIDARGQRCGARDAPLAIFFLASEPYYFLDQVLSSLPERAATSMHPQNAAVRLDFAQHLQECQFRVLNHVLVRADQEILRINSLVFVMMSTVGHLVHQ